jgi:hypothetical protein
MMADSGSPVSKWQPDGEREMILTVKNTFLHLEHMPSPCARPARRCGTAPEALLTAVLEPRHLCGECDGDSSGAHSLQAEEEEESSDGDTPRSGIPECQGDSADWVVPDEIEMRVTVRNTFLHLEPAVSELSLRTGTARRHKTAPEILLTAVFARDSPRSGAECSSGPEGGEKGASTRAPSSRVSAADSCEMDDVVSDCPIGEESKQALGKKKGADKSNGLKNASGRRPGKKARERYQALVVALQDMVRQDPWFSLESFPLPPSIVQNEELMARLVARVEAARL